MDAHENKSASICTHMEFCGHPDWAAAWRRDLQTIADKDKLIARLARHIEELGSNAEPLLGEST